MARRRNLVIALVSVALAATTASDARAATAAQGAGQEPRGATRAYRPDGWIKLCGLSNGCMINPPPHPWRGKDVYNRTGRRQTISNRINEGEGIRYWIAVQNDGSQSDTIRIQGCRETRTYEINRVLLGKHRRRDPSATDLTRRYIRGTLTFDLDPGQKVIFTLNIITHFNKGVTYRCRTEMYSLGRDTAQDVVVAKMTTY